MRSIFIALLVSSSLSLISCGGGSDQSTSISYDAFGTPEQISIVGYSSDIMEPFFSRDELFLFFNDNAFGGKNLHFASYESATDVFNYVGEVGPNINDGNSVQGVPTMDNNYTLYFVDTKGYDPLGAPPVYTTLFTGTWDGATVTGVTEVTNIAVPIAGFLNFDIDISPDGNTLYFNDGFFSGNPFPDGAEIKIANYNSTNGKFERAPDADSIMANVNTTTNLEYAPAISNDGLELFFTRLDLMTLDARIYRTTRAIAGAVFGPPQIVTAIPGFAEGVTYSQNEKTIYYHWHNTVLIRFELYRVSRP